MSTNMKSYIIEHETRGVLVDWIPWDSIERRPRARFMWSISRFDEKVMKFRSQAKAIEILREVRKVAPKCYVVSFPGAVRILDV